MFQKLNSSVLMPKTVQRRKRFRPACERLENRCLLSSYFVAPGGNDAGTGSLDHPFATIQRALDLATTPGDVVEVREGTYKEQIVFPASGAAPIWLSTDRATDRSIILRAFAGEHPILDGTDAQGSNMVLIQKVSYVKIIGFEIANLSGVDDGSGIRVVGACANIEIRENRIHNLRGLSAMGITVYGTATAPIARLVIDGNEIYDSEPSPSEALTLNGNVTNFVVSNNTIHDINNIGIDIIGGEKSIHRTQVARNGVVFGNTVFNARSPEGFGAGIYVDGGKNIIVENNITHDNDIGIEVGAENRGIIASKIIVRNNLIYRNDKIGLAFGGYDALRGRVQSSIFVNNTLCQNDTLNTGNGQLLIQFASRNVVANNIFVAAANNVLLASFGGSIGNWLNNNVWLAAGVNDSMFSWNDRGFATFAEYRTVTHQDAASKFADPLFVDAATANFHLQEGSPAIDAGTTLAGRFARADFEGRSRLVDGAPHPDAGALEFAAASSATLSSDQKRRAEQITSIFENDTIELQYGYIDNIGDGRGYTAGRAGFTTATADLLDVVRRYTAHLPTNGLARYLPRLAGLARAASPATTGLPGIMAAWHSAALDPLFRYVEDQVVDDTYYQPALGHGLEQGLHTALGLAVLYDTIIQHGDGTGSETLSGLLAETNIELGGNPASGVDEKTWVTRFLQVRRRHLDTPEWLLTAQRADVLLNIASQDNYDLIGPIVIAGFEYSPATIP